jgi:hypothetical protein
MNKTREAPSHVQGVAVEAIGEPMVLRGVTWITLVPVDDDDDRLWEWCPSTGRIVQTRP